MADARDLAATVDLHERINDAIEHVTDPWVLCSLLGEAAAALAALVKQAEDAQAEADWQMASKLEAQQALMAITAALDLTLSEIGEGWKEGVLHILARIEQIVDAANADAARAVRAEEDLRQSEEARETLRGGLANVLASAGVPEYVRQNVEHYLAAAGADTAPDA